MKELIDLYTVDREHAGMKLFVERNCLKGHTGWLFMFASLTVKARC